MKTVKQTTRRKFLLAAGLGGAGAVAVVAAGGKAPSGATQAAAAPAEAPQGYRASEHVLKYYKTTEV